MSKYIFQFVKRITAVLFIMVVVVCIPSIVSMEDTAKGNSVTSADIYMKRGIRAVYDNMHLIYEAYYDNTGKLELQPTGHVAIEQVWDNNWNLISRSYLGTDGKPVNRTDGYSKAEWKMDENGKKVLYFYDSNGERVTGVHIFLVKDIREGNDGWSDWMTPKPDTENYCFTIGYADLGEKTIGDQYTCSVEVEVRDVEGTEGKDFWFVSHGAVDEVWNIGNVWNKGLISFREPLKDKVYQYVFTTEITEKMADASVFDLGFRCDYWHSGKFRIRKIKVEKRSK